MTDKQSTPPTQADRPDENDISLLDVLIILARRKKMILGASAASMVIVAVIVFFLPNVYSATTRLLPPQQAQSGSAAILAQLGGIASVVNSGAGVKNPNDVYLAMLRSRTIADKLVTRFNLIAVYDTKSAATARRILEENSSISSGKDGLIDVTIEGHDSKLVTSLANAYVDELLQLTKTLAVTEASQRRMFYERQLELSKDNLAKAEMNFKSALDTHGVISVDSDSKAVVETIGRVRAEISVKEIQLRAMAAFVTQNNQDYKQAREVLNSLRAQLSRLENGSAPPTDNVNARKPKQVGLENIKILRDVKYHQMLYELLAKQYELARLDEAKDPSIIQVLDVAIEPERHVRPKRILLVLLASLGGAVVGIALAFAVEAKNRVLRRPGGALQWKELKSELRLG